MLISKTGKRFCEFTTSCNNLYEQSIARSTEEVGSLGIQSLVIRKNYLYFTSEIQNVMFMFHAITCII